MAHTTSGVSFSLISPFFLKDTPLVISESAVNSFFVLSTDGGGGVTPLGFVIVAIVRFFIFAGFAGVISSPSKGYDFISEADRNHSSSLKDS